MKTRIFKIGLLGALLAFASVASAANKFDYIDLTKGDGIHPNDGKIIINPINGNYGVATKTTVPYHVKVRAGCKRSNLLIYTFVAFGNEVVTKTHLEASGNYRVNAPTNLKKTIGWTNVEMNVPMNKLGFNPAAMCQADMNKKISQGLTKMQYLNSDHILKAPVLFTAVARCGTPNHGTHHYGKDTIGAEFQVICKKGSSSGIGGIQTKQPGPITGGNTIQAKAFVTKLTFKAWPKHKYAKCPTHAKFNGTITSAGAGDVKYRVLFPNASKTNVMTLKFTKAGTKNVGPFFYQTSKSIPVGAATLEVIAPNSKKKHANFKVTCISAGGPSGGIQSPGGANPGRGNIRR